MDTCKVALLLGDSILKDVFDNSTTDFNDFKNYFCFDQVYSQFTGGVTFQTVCQKDFQRKMSEINHAHKENYAVSVFVCVGAVDLSDALPSSLEKVDKNHLLKTRLDFCKVIMDDPMVESLSLFPLTPQRTCFSRLKERFPKYADPNWIGMIIIQSVNSGASQYRHTKFTPISNNSNQDISQFLTNDGLHFTLEGKSLFFRLILTQKKPHPIFSKEDFPALLPKDLGTSPLRPIDCRIAKLERRRQVLCTKPILDDPKVSDAAKEDAPQPCPCTAPAHTPQPCPSTAHVPQP